MPAPPMPGCSRPRSSPSTTTSWPGASRYCAPNRPRPCRKRRKTMAEKRGAALPPGSTIGILGSGQLGRMLAMAAARLGLKTHIYCEDSGPAFDVAASTTKARFDDVAALGKFAQSVGAVTYEFENVPIATVQYLSGLVPVRPSARAIEVAQDRLVEKQFIHSLGIPVAPVRAVAPPADIASGRREFSWPAIPN